MGRESGEEMDRVALNRQEFSELDITPQQEFHGSVPINRL